MCSEGSSEDDLFMSENEKERWRLAIEYWKIKLRDIEEELKKDKVNPQNIEWKLKQILCSLYAELRRNE